MDLHSTPTDAEAVAQATSRERRGLLMTVYRVSLAGRTLGYAVAAGESPGTQLGGGLVRVPLASWRDGLPRLCWLPESRNGGVRRADALAIAKSKARLTRLIKARGKGRPRALPEG